MYLSLLEIDVSDRRGRTWLANPYRVHQRLLMAFPDGESGRLLFRIEDERRPPHIVVQTTVPADWEKAFADHPVLAGSPRQKQVSVNIPTGKKLRFLLRANPTVRRMAEIPRDGGTGLPAGKRQGLLREDEQRMWLDRKGQMCGFRPLAFEARSLGFKKVGGRNHDKSEQTHLSVDFEGYLVVTDPLVFREILVAGIGSAKGYGFGLLSIAPA